ncbi:MAG: Crp/Fnr family transcriptional regulator [Thermoanaerobaculales bacterium]|jgi:CRP/FNR family transcriptional regulator|nr:Crp/Fnr family transcriptional regulator [Thermoanaerobaculales bacterium]
MRRTEMSSIGLVDRARRAFGFLERLEPEAWQRFSSGVTEVRLPAGATMFRPGDGCDGFGFVLEGSVKVGLVSESGREIVLYRVRPGESCTVTVSCLVTGSTYPATGIVERDLTAAAIPRFVFADLVDLSPVFRRFVLEALSIRITDLMELVDEVAFNKLDRRLAARLLELGPRVKLSHGELAGELGTGRVIVSRILESFADQGLVTLGRRSVTVADPDGLRTRFG